MPTIDEKSAELINTLNKLADHYISSQASLAKDRLAELSKQEFTVVIRLGRDGEHTMSELAHKINLSVSSATLIVDKLNEKKLISRIRSEDDRRVVRVRLTEEGIEAFNVANRAMLTLGKAMLEALEEHEQDMLLTLFGKISNNLKPIAR